MLYMYGVWKHTMVESDDANTSHKFGKYLPGVLSGSCWENSPMYFGITINRIGTHGWQPRPRRAFWLVGTKAGCCI
eukprot:8050470-Karenia_brevis.AAC.1